MIKEIFFIGANQAGCIGLLTILAAGYKISGIVAYDNIIDDLATVLNIPRFSSISEREVEILLGKSDLLVSVHGKQIVPKELLELPRLGGINAHPCLYAYPGADPVNRLLDDGKTLASVGVHRMTERVDEGEVLSEDFIDVTGKVSVEEVYNALYPYYSMGLLVTLRLLEVSENG